MPGQTLWRAIHDYIAEQGVVSRARVLQRFRYDDEAIVRSVLHDLNENGIAFCTGKGDSALFRLVSDDEINYEPGRSQAATEAVLWVVIHRFGPITEAEMMEHVKLDADVCREAIDGLLADARIGCDDSGQEPSYSADAYKIPMGTTHGWEAAVFDHYQAVVTTLSQKVRSGDTMAKMKDKIGGSTFCYDLWDGHPQSDQVDSLLSEFRQRCFEVQKEVDSHATNHGDGPTPGHRRVTVYVGQSMIYDDEAIDD